MTVILLILALVFITLIVILLIKLSARNNEKIEKCFRDMSLKLEEDLQQSIRSFRDEFKSEINRLSKDDDE